MNPNRHHPSRKFAPQKQNFLGIEPAWWGLTVVAAISFVCAIYWLLVRPLDAV
jgi:hypothetical protein